MIPKLELDKEFIKKTWENPEAEEVERLTEVFELGPEKIPVYPCQDTWIRCGVFKKFKDTIPTSEFFEYGYCDSEDILCKYLKSYLEDKDNNFFVHVGILSMDHSKYYKFGSYINKDGVDTGEDYYDWIREHPEDKDKQQFPNEWIMFSIVKLK